MDIQKKAEIPIGLGSSYGEELKEAPVVVHDHFKRKERWPWGATTLWVLMASCYFITPSYLLLITQMLSSALFALSLHLILGLGGIVSLGHAAFFGVGAYAAALISSYGFHDPLIGMLAAVISSGLLGFISCVIVIRLRGIALLMVTMGLALLLKEIVRQAKDVTGGDDGLGISLAPLFGIFEFDMWGRTGFVYTLVIVMICFIFAHRLSSSPFGLALSAMRENIFRLPSIGVSVSLLSTKVYIISAILAGVAGALLTQSTEFVSTNVLSFQRSAEVLVMLALGGAGYLYGGLVGAFVFMAMREILSALSPEYWFFGIGMMLVVVVVFSRDGLVGASSHLFRQVNNLIKGQQ